MAWGCGFHHFGWSKHRAVAADSWVWRCSTSRPLRCCCCSASLSSWRPRKELDWGVSWIMTYPGISPSQVEVDSKDQSDSVWKWKMSLWLMILGGYHIIKYKSTIPRHGAMWKETTSTPPCQTPLTRLLGIPMQASFSSCLGQLFFADLQLLLLSADVSWSESLQ